MLQELRSLGDASTNLLNIGSTTHVIVCVPVIPVLFMFKVSSFVHIVIQPIIPFKLLGSRFTCILCRSLFWHRGSIQQSTGILFMFVTKDL